MTIVMNLFACFARGHSSRETESHRVSKCVLNCIRNCYLVFQNGLHTQSSVRVLSSCCQASSTLGIWSLFTDRHLGGYIVASHFSFKKNSTLSAFLSRWNIIHTLYRKRRHCRCINKNVKNHPDKILFRRKDLIFFSECH